MSTLRRLEPFLYSRRNLVGSAMGIGGLALFFSGIVGGPLGIGVTVALYAIGVLVVPPQRTVSVDLSTGIDMDKVTDGLNALIRSISGKVAPDIVSKVMSIRDSIVATLPSGSDAEAGDPNVYLIQQTALTYLPQALAAYQAVPRLIAEQRPVANGRTPHDVLLDQLNLMDSKLQEVANDLARHDSDRLLANGRFLAERFGTSSLQIGANVPIGQAIATGSASAATSAATPAADPEAAAARDRQRVR